MGKTNSSSIMRWGVSPKAGASISNAALTDAGVVTRDNQTNIIEQVEKADGQLSS